MDHTLRRAAPRESLAAGRALPPDVAPGGRPRWRVLALSGVAASLWVAVVYALGRGLSVHELAGDGAAVLLLPAVMYALEGIAARWRRRLPAAHRRANRRPVNR